LPPAGGDPPLGEQRLALAISAQNGEGLRVVVSATVSPGGPEVDATHAVRRSSIHHVAQSTEPDPADVLHVGLIGLWTHTDG
jgi:hypothetical protein